MGAVGTPGDRQSDEVLLAGLGAGDPELAVAFVRRFQRIAATCGEPQSCSMRIDQLVAFVLTRVSTTPSTALKIVSKARSNSRAT